tara:strand:- start:2592 stop:3500 length:909 start_codon:yes stop_codon:yes gene_type:complete
MKFTPGVVRLIARLDVKGPNLIKGIQFDGHRVLGVPEDFADMYYKEGIDEFIFQDSVASLYCRNSLSDIIKRTAKNVSVPITVAGGLRSVSDIEKCLESGADKVAINTAAVSDPKLLNESVKVFGSQCIVASIETYKHENGKYEIWTDYGRQETGLDTFEWVDRVVDAGVGEIFLTSINNEGKGQGYDIDLVKRVATNVTIPVIALGGAGNLDDLVDVVNMGKADAVAVASCYHYNYCERVEKKYMQFNEDKLRMGKQIDSGNITFLNYGYGGFTSVPVEKFSIPQAKNFMHSNGINVRTPS